jgi:hypothetical protein
MLSMHAALSEAVEFPVQQTDQPFCPTVDLDEIGENVGTLLGLVRTYGCACPKKVKRNYTLLYLEVFRMGLFDIFKGDKSTEGMTPHFVFATSLLYMMQSDGEMDHEEVGQLLAVLGGEEQNGVIGVGANNRQLLDRALKYIRSNPIEKFLKEAAPVLTDAQKMCILINLVDSSLSDGQPEQEEQLLFAKFLDGFGISEERFTPFFEVIVLKNDRSVFLNQNHPKNQPGYQVSLHV